MLRRALHRFGPERLMVIALVLVLAGVIAQRTLHGEDRRLVPGGGSTQRTYDPLAYEPSQDAELADRAARGFAHPLYAKSPGGAVATAQRTARWRAGVDTAARTAGVDPDLVEGVVLLESAGRPEARAGDLSGAVGLTQILAETGRNLLGLQVDLRRSAPLTRAIERADRSGGRRRAQRLRAQRRRVDQRFDPTAALRATGRYLRLARRRFGREDLAVVSYHMGIGNLEGALRAYAGAWSRTPIRRVVERRGLSYARLYFDSSPLRHRSAWARLARLGDDSSTYLWRVLAARDIMRRWRDDPRTLDDLAAAQLARNSAEQVLHPPDSTPRFATPADVADARDDGTLSALPAAAATRLGFRPAAALGELAPQVGQSPSLYRALRPEALAALGYLGAGVRAIARERGPLALTSAVRDERYQALLVPRNQEAARGYSLHTTGYAFDIARRYRSRRQALAFQFMLDRLQAHDLIAWVREPEAIHVAVSGDAARLVDALERLGTKGG